MPCSDLPGVRLGAGIFDTQHQRPEESSLDSGNQNETSRDANQKPLQMAASLSSMVATSSVLACNVEAETRG